MNSFEALAKLASEERWCWKIHCTTCGHLHFRYAFLQIANGVHPDEKGWVVHKNTTRYHRSLGPIPKGPMSDFSLKNKEHLLLQPCIDSNLKKIALHCIFPDWLGFLGLVLVHMKSPTSIFLKLSKNWAFQLNNMLNSGIQSRSVFSLEESGSKLLDIQDLEYCEAMMPSKHIRRTTDYR